MSSSLADLVTDSLIAPEILSCLKDALGVEISSVDFAAAVDVNSLCELVRAGLGHSSSSSSVSPSSSRSTSISAASILESDEQEMTTKPGSRSNPTSAHAAFPQVRRSFNDHADATGFTGYWDQVYPHQLRTVAKFITEAFEKLGCRTTSFKPGETLPAVQGTLPRYQREVTRLWQILEEAGPVTARIESNNRVYIRGTASFDYNMGGPGAECQARL